MANENNRKEKLARFGIASKGFVYCLIGGLTVMTAFDLGGKKTGSQGALESLAGGTFGTILLVLTAVGLLGFVFWRLYQTFEDPDDKGNDAKGIARRIGYLSSAVFYGLLAFTAFQLIMGSQGGGSGGGKESLVSTLLNQEFGQFIVFLLAVIFAGKAIYQVYRAYSGKFQEKVEDTNLQENVRSFILKAGKIGYTARGVVIAIIAYFTFRAAFTANSESAGGTKQAFDFLQNEFGTIEIGRAHV